jgi:hypothetical protein
MKTLVYKIHKVEEDSSNTKLIEKGEESEIREKWESIGIGHELSVGWELNGKSLGTTLLEWK